MTDLLVENENDIELDIEGASVSMNAKWGDITGNINEQTDLMTIIDGKADDDEVVKTTGNQEIGGEKTFNEPVHLINDDGTIPLLVVHDGVDDKTGLGQYGFNLDYETENEKVLAFPLLEESDTIATQGQLNSKANDDSVVHNTGTESIDGEKSFIKKATFEDGIEVIGGTLQTNSFEIIETDTIVVDGENYSFGGVGGTLATTSDLASKEDKSNKVVSLSAQSTDTEYPSAKCVYDIVGNIESLLEAI